jgi:hypothetical protein
MATPGIKSMRGRPEAFDEPKIPTCLSLTQTARDWLQETAAEMNTSWSDLIEQIARSRINIPLPVSDRVSDNCLAQEASSPDQHLT